MACALYCIADLTSLLSFYLILRFVFKEIPRTEPWRPALCAVICAAIDVSGYLLLVPKTEHAFEILDFAATAIALVSIPLLFYRPRFWRGFAVLFIYYATIDTLWSFLSTFLGTDIVWEAVFNLAITVAVSVAVYRGSDHKDLNAVAGALHEVPVWLLISLFLFELTGYYKEFGLSEKWYDFLYAISACLILLSVLYLIFRVFRLVHTQKDILQKLDDQLAYETRRAASDEDLRAFRHDFRNHSIVLNSMLEQGDVEGAKKYFSGLSSDVAAALPRFSTGNAVVDSLLNIKAAEALAQNTEIAFSGVIPDTGTDPKDMCVCFGNLLDNALEACAALPAGIERSVGIRAVIKNNLLVISFVNPAASSNRFSGKELPKTTKKDVKAHGIGLKNVRDTVKKYNGSLHLSAERGQFTAEIIFELAEPETDG